MYNLRSTSTVKNYITHFTSSLLPYVFVFIASIYRPLDPDLGWHLRYGEYFFTHGKLLSENIHASEMADFHWSNISWGIDLLYYLFYQLGGFLGLSLAGAAVITLTFFFFSRAFQLNYWEKAIIFPIILFFQHPVNINSFRGQLVSTLLLGLLFLIIKKFERENDKSLYFVPLLFLFWANLHGLFLLGLAIFMLWEGLFLLSTFLRQRTVKSVLPHLRLFIIITALSFLATLIHPSGIGIYYDALLHFNNPLLKWVSEYGAIEELSGQWFRLIITAIFAGMGITSFILMKSTNKQLPSIGIFTVLYFMSLWVRRYLWAMYYFLIPLLQPIVKLVSPSSKKGIFRGATFLFLLYLPIVVFLKFPFSQYSVYSWNDYCKEMLQCSPKAAETLRKYYKEGATMTPYSWGGWMIWNYPDMKPSTDGRMHLWRDEKGYSGFEHDYKLAHGIDSIDSSKYDVVLAMKNRSIYKKLRTLAAQKRWRLVYVDQSAAIFLRK
jgi:hypothetical protein